METMGKINDNNCILVHSNNEDPTKVSVVYSTKTTTSMMGYAFAFGALASALVIMEVNLIRSYRKNK